MADTKHTILIIDDDKFLVESLSGALVDAGYDVLTAINGEKGLALALEKKPDLIVLDYQMPVMDGAKMLTELRADEWGAHATVVMATNIYDVELLNQVMQQGVNEYILKSDSSLEQIVALIDKHFETK